MPPRKRVAPKPVDETQDDKITEPIPVAEKARPGRAVMLHRTTPLGVSDSVEYAVDPPYEGHDKILLVRTYADRGGFASTWVYGTTEYSENFGAQLPGSVNGTHGHEEVLRDIGYVLD